MMMAVIYGGAMAKFRQTKPLESRAITIQRETTGVVVVQNIITHTNTKTKKQTKTQVLLAVAFVVVVVVFWFSDIGVLKSLSMKIQAVRFSASGRRMPLKPRSNNRSIPLMPAHACSLVWRGT